MELGGLGGFASVATDLNNAGDVVGFDMFAGAHAEDFTNTRAWVIPAGGTSAIALATLGGATSRVFSIDESGRMFGYTEDEAGNLVATRWDSPNEAMSLGRIAAYRQSFAYRSTPDGRFTVGHAAGGVGNPQGAAFVESNVLIHGHRAAMFTHGRVIDLNELIEPIAGLHMRSAFDITPDGYIVGSARLGGDNRAIVLTPCAPLITVEPEPRTICGQASISFSIETAPFGEGPSFSWQRNGVALSPGGRLTIDVAQDGRSSTLTITSPEPGDAGQYDVVLTNDCGSSVSQPANLSSGVSGPTVPGDTNGDGSVAFNDITEVLTHFGAACN